MLPTDLEILNKIYDRYYDDFASGESKRSSKIYVPIDTAAIAESLGVDGDIVFGRLYYHLQRKHGYMDAAGDGVPFFTLQAGKDRHCIHFPLMASVLADLQSQHRQFWTATTTAFVSLAVSVLALVVSLFIN